MQGVTQHISRALSFPIHTTVSEPGISMAITLLVMSRVFHKLDAQHCIIRGDYSIRGMMFKGHCDCLPLTVDHLNMSALCCLRLVSSNEQSPIQKRDDVVCNALRMNFGTSGRPITFTYSRRQDKDKTVDDVVIVKDGSLPRNRWPLDCVVQTYSSDNDWLGR